MTHTTAEAAIASARCLPQRECAPPRVVTVARRRFSRRTVSTRFQRNVSTLQQFCSKLSPCAVRRECVCEDKSGQERRDNRAVAIFFNSNS
jgi:hypothetical protein